MSLHSSNRRFYHSIRFKLLLVALTLLVIPWAGYRFIQETENFLRESQETMLLGTAQAVATILHNRDDMFTSSRPAYEGAGPDAAIYIHPLHSNIQLDGYIEDWTPYLQNLWNYRGNDGTEFDSLVGERGNYLYLLFRVRDDYIVYQQPGSGRTDQGDHLDIAMQRPDGDLARYRITTSAPGWVNARLLSSNPLDPEPQGSEIRIQGEWQESSDGYIVELRIPKDLVGERLGFRLTDVDDSSSREVAGWASSADIRQIETLGWLITPNPILEKTISGLEHESARIWVLDRSRRVLAKRGQLRPTQSDPATSSGNELSSNILHLLIRMALDQPSGEFVDELAGATHLQSPEIESALSGTPDTRRRTTADGEAVILSAAWPIRSSDTVIGSVVVEQSTNQILSLQNRALEQLFGITITFFTITGLVLLGFATLLTSRIARLRNRVEEAVTHDGRILSQLKPTRSRDEIGDLDRSFAGVLNRLSEYNRYLEAMASRLAHEMQTPITVVRSSLENLESDPSPEEHQRYIQRAQDGTARLGKILHRMREATRLEQLLQQTELEQFDLVSLVQTSLESYRTAFPDILFEAEITQPELSINGAPDLISQALDKLVNNAMDFHTSGSAILVQLGVNERGEISLSVSNRGPALPEGMERELFQSMVSMRKLKSEEPHLGLGLYLVRLICEFHGGKAEANNLPQHDGVRISMLMPVQ
ncbi:MAG: proteobacterial dedicated sortase system histidine kinase [Gammaproteobacteria bacterium]|nr:proteobacterial dedicated sortase system histidine kinase [Gammaproteobacteria bacterium]